MELRNILLSTTAMGLSMPAAAWAQQAPPATEPKVIQAPAPEAEPQPAHGVQDIVVTARRVEERLQDVPVAVTGFNEEMLRNLQIENFGDIGKAVPNLDAQRQFGSASAPQFYLRGIQTGSLKFET